MEIGLGLFGYSDFHRTGLYDSVISIERLFVSRGDKMVFSLGYGCRSRIRGIYPRSVDS
jgi:hypothetical protein